MFRKYMHVERLGATEVDGIELGTSYIFPKIDGTNGSVWFNEGKLEAGSRNRVLSLDNDNQGFLAHCVEDMRLQGYLASNPFYILYGEWLVPHSLRTYRESSWNNFYIFDVFDRREDRYLSFTEYEALLRDFELDYISPLAVIANADSKSIARQLELNTFLIENGKGIGEGIVIKNYEYTNSFGRTVWAKVVNNEFKDAHRKEMGVRPINLDSVEKSIAAKWITPSLVDKVYFKIVNEESGWSSKYIPKLFNTVYYDLVKEDLWTVLKEFKRPTINFKTLFNLVVLKVKLYKPELF